MATFEGEVLNNGSGTSLGVSVTAQAGELLVACVQSRNTTITGVSDPTNGAWTLARNQGSDPSTAIYYKANAAAGTYTVTAAFGASSAAGFLSVSRVSGADGSSPQDQVNSATNASGTSHPAGEITTTSAGIIFSAAVLFGFGNTKTAATGFTALGQFEVDGRSFNQYKVSASPETTTATFTTSGEVQSSHVVASFKDAATAALPPRAALMKPSSALPRWRRQVRV